MTRDIGDYHELNKFRLDEELEIQVKMYREHAEKLAEAKRNTEIARTHYDITKTETKKLLEEKLADIEMKVRSDPENFGVETPVREGAVGCAITAHPEVKSIKLMISKRLEKAKKEVIQAEYDEEIHKVAVNTLEHRKIAITKLVDLFLGDYFSKPKITNEKKNRMDEETRNKILEPKKRAN